MQGHIQYTPIPPSSPILVINSSLCLGILALGSSVPQRLRQGRQGSSRQGRQGTSYLPPADEPLPSASNQAPR